MFIDREDAGKKLGVALDKYRNKNVLVLGIPRGGAETAYHVANYLKADLALVITRKLGYPFNPETAFGAIAEDGSTYISENAKQVLSEKTIKKVIDEQKVEIQRRIQVLRRGSPLPDLKNKIVIIVDDGIATGATLFATIELCKNKRADKLVVAAPISGIEMKSKLKKLVDEVVILETPDSYWAVSQGYENFFNLTDEEALAFMEKWEKEHGVHA